MGPDLAPVATANPRAGRVSSRPTGCPPGFGGSPGPKALRPWRTRPGPSRTTATRTTSGRGRRRAAAGGPDAAKRDRGAEDRARQEHVPRLQAGARGADATTTTAPTSCSRATRPADGRGLHHAHQPRRRRRAPGDADGDAGRRRQRRCRRSTARRGSRSPSGCSSRRRARTSRPTRRRRTPVDGRRRVRRARPRRLRGHPGRLRRQHLDRRGHRRRAKRGHDGQVPQQLRLPLRPAHRGDLDAAASSRRSRCATPDGHRSRSQSRRPSTRPTRCCCTGYGTRFARAG